MLALDLLLNCLRSRRIFCSLKNLFQRFFKNVFHPEHEGDITKFTIKVVSSFKKPLPRKKTKAIKIHSTTAEHLLNSKGRAPPASLAKSKDVQGEWGSAISRSQRRERREDREDRGGGRRSRGGDGRRMRGYREGGGSLWGRGGSGSREGWEGKGRSRGHTVPGCVGWGIMEDPVAF